MESEGFHECLNQTSWRSSLGELIKHEIYSLILLRTRTFQFSVGVCSDERHSGWLKFVESEGLHACFFQP